MTMSDEKKYLIKRLTSLLKENGASVLTDGAPLSLTISFLHFLNQGFSVLVDDDFGASFEALPGSSTRVPICQDLQFLYDFIQKTPKLKLIYDSAFSGEVTSVAAFRSLLEFELKRVPAAMVTGLSKLRRKLKVLVCIRCLQHLEDILEHHEVESSLMWTQLTKLCCSYNFITELDNSLRLLPVVQELDLSHNSIYDTDSYLEHLTELQSLDLGFNLLSVVPSLSLSTQNKLKKLCLRHNQLENIEGIQELHNLTDLDLCYNCLSLHRLLWPLRELEKLELLLLEGNPLSYHSKHRLLTVEQLHPIVVKQLVLDRRKLTAQECLVVRSVSLVAPSSPLPRQQSAGMRDCISLPASDFVDSPDESAICSASSLPSPQRKIKIQRKKKQRKPRTVEITDADDTIAERNTEGPTAEKPEIFVAKNFNLKERIDAKKEIEVIRKQLGPDWLQTLTAAQESANPSEPVKETMNQMTAEEQLPVKTTSEVAEQNGNRSGSESGSYRCEEAAPTPKRSADAETDGVDGAAIMTLESLNAMAKAVDDAPGSPTETEVGHPDNVFSWSKAEPADVDYGLESDPFIVCQPEGGSTDHFLVTVAERYILEKDIEGNVIEALDQRCLKRVELVTGDETARVVQRANDDLILVRLYFDYYKRDKTERCYVMEDMKSAENLVELLEPAMELYKMSEALQDLLQCLKCSTQFSLSENKKKFAAGQTDDVRRCPKCKSDLIIELDMGQISRSVGQHGMMTFDLQSEGPGGMPYKPALHSTPVKSQDSNRLVYNDSPHGSLHSTSVQLDSPLRMRRNASSVSLDSKVTRRSMEAVSGAVDLSAKPQQASTIRTPRRQVSESSDIIVLDEKRQSMTSQSSDIAVLTGSNEMTSSAPVLSPIRDSPVETLPGGHHQSHDQSGEVTPYGSLSENTIHSMVSSVYENTMSDVQDSRSFVSFCDDDNPPGIQREDDSYLSNQSFQSIQEPDVTRSFVGGAAPEVLSRSIASASDVGFNSDHIRFSFTDYTFIDHRLKLYLSLDVIGGDEELCLLLQCDVLSVDEPVECSGIVVITNTKLYVFNTELPLSAESLTKNLKLKHSVELSQLKMIVQGLGAMCLYVLWEKAAYRLLIRDEKRCQNFVKVLTAHLQTLATPPNLALKAITTEQVTAKNAVAEVLRVSDTDAETDICLYVTCHQQIGALDSGEADLSPVSLFVSPGHVAMVTEDPSYVLEELRGDLAQPIKSKATRKQFEVKDLQKLTDIVTIEIQSSNPHAVSLTFTEEGSSEEYTWHLVMATTDTRQSFVTMVTRLWEEQFGVEFICKYV